MKLIGVLLALSCAASAVALPQPGVGDKRSNGGLSDNLCKLVREQHMDCEADITALITASGTAYKIFSDAAKSESNDGIRKEKEQRAAALYKLSTMLLLFKEGVLHTGS